MTSSKTLPRIHNFKQVTPWLFRGGQPSDEGLRQLAEFGIKTIISLRSGKVGARFERQKAEALGMQLVHYPVTYFKLPDDSQIAEYLSLLEERTKGPFFIHCLHGCDRTGFMIALFRMAAMNWPVEQAYAEMKSCGFHTIRLPHFKWVLWDYASKVAPIANTRSSSLPGEGVGR